MNFLLLKPRGIFRYFIIVLSFFFVILNFTSQKISAQEIITADCTATPEDPTCLYGLVEAADYGGFETKDRDIATIVGGIISSALGLLGVLFLVLMIFGGYLWMTARGNEEQIKKAQSLITNAVIGVIIVLAAYAITWFITEQLLGAVGEGG